MKATGQESVTGHHIRVVDWSQSFDQRQQEPSRYDFDIKWNEEDPYNEVFLSAFGQDVAVLRNNWLSEVALVDIKRKTHRVVDLKNDALINLCVSELYEAYIYGDVIEVISSDGSSDSVVIRKIPAIELELAWCQYESLTSYIFENELYIQGGSYIWCIALDCAAPCRKIDLADVCEKFTSPTIRDMIVCEDEIYLLLGSLRKYICVINKADATVQRSWEVSHSAERIAIADMKLAVLEGFKIRVFV